MAFLGGIPIIPHGKLDAVDDSAKARLGQRAFDEKGNLYIYLKGVASTEVGSVVVYYDDDYTTALATKTEIDKLYPLAVAMAAIVANKYGWYCIQGEADIMVLANCAAEVALYSSATAGALDDTSTSQTKINRAVLHAACGGSAAATSGHIDFPSAA